MNNFYNEHPYGIGEYEHRLLDEKIVQLSQNIAGIEQNVTEHTSNDSIHVTEEDKERWNSAAEAISNSSDQTDDDTSSAMTAEDVLQLVDDQGYIKEIPSHYATEEEVRSWLNDYVTYEYYGTHDGGGSQNSNEDWTDGDIIDRFKLDETAKPINSSTKSIRLVLNKESNEIQLQTIQSFSAQIKITPNHLEYKQPGKIKAEAIFTDGTMRSVEVWNDLESTPVDVMSLPHNYSIASMPASSVKFNLAYESITGDTNTIYTSLSVYKKWYHWNSSTSGETTIPNDAQNELRESKPSDFQCTAGSQQYTYMAFPKSWNVNPANFTYGGMSFDYVKDGNGDIPETNGKYGDTNDYIIVQSTEKGLEDKIHL